jgi:S-formylglutathione hydrolase
VQKIEQHNCFGGVQEVWRHTSKALACDMQFGIYLPPQAALQRCPVLYWLSGLTCSEQNFITKAGAQAHAAEHGLILVAPDTSPRGSEVPNHDSFALGQGASFYVNATQAPWSQHFKMEDYITAELPALIEQNFAATDTRSISGHSMGGHGALVLSLRHPGRYRSVSAFSPIVAPSQVPWGQQALAMYLGPEQEAWQAYDSVALVAHAKERLPWLVHQGLADEFLPEHLRPELLEDACRRAAHPLSLHRVEGYDHSYYFVSSFMPQHIAHHARVLVG